MTTRQTSTSPERTASQTYAVRRNDVARLLDVLQMHLDINDKAHAAEPAHWGFVENLGKVRADLVNLVGFMANMDPEHVEDFLQDE